MLTQNKTEVLAPRFTVQQFIEMGELGYFKAQHVELVHGEIIVMLPQGFQHAEWLERLHEKLLIALQGQARVRNQSPVVVDAEQNDYLEPDLSVLRKSDEYATRHVQPCDVQIAIEISKTTLRYDRTEKLALYAFYGVPEVWILNVDKGKLEVYRDLRDGEYASRITLEPGEVVTPIAFPELKLEWWI
jgi:Uma2 family endonuclease